MWTVFILKVRASVFSWSKIELYYKHKMFIAWNRLLAIKIIKRWFCGGNQKYVSKSTYTALLFAWDKKVLVLICLYVHVVSCFSGNFSTLLIFSFTSECLLPAVMQWFVILSSPHSNASRLRSHLRIKETPSHTEIMIKTGLWRFIFYP